MNRRLVGAVAILAACVVGLPAVAAPTPVWVSTHPVQSSYFHDVTALRDGTAWAVVDGDRVLRSTDYGRRWLPVAPPAPGPTIRFGLPSPQVFVAPVSSTVAYRSDQEYLWRTSDAGTTWARLEIPRVGRGRSVDWVEGLEYTGGALWAPRGTSERPDEDSCPRPSPTTPLHATADGRRWRRADIPFKDGGIDAIRFRDARNGVALVAEYVWSEPERDGNFCYLEGISEHSGVYVTRDGGKRWQRTFQCRYHCEAPQV